MRIKVFTGEIDADAFGLFSRTIVADGYHSHETAPTIYFPEYQDTPKHPLQLFREIREEIINRIDMRRDLYILTYSNDVFNAVRCACKYCAYGEAKVYFAYRNNDMEIVKILADGKINDWPNDEFFGSLEVELTELL